MVLNSAAKILIVDDMVAMLVALRRALAQMGFVNIVEAENGAEALAVLRAHPDVALIISDWNMEPMDGLELLAAVRADRQLAQTPFILASAETSDVLRERARTAGASSVLAKPFDAATLHETMVSLP